MYIIIKFIWLFRIAQWQNVWLSEWFIKQIVNWLGWKYSTIILRIFKWS